MEYKRTNICTQRTPAGDTCRFVVGRRCGSGFVGDGWFCSLPIWRCGCELLVVAYIAILILVRYKVVVLGSQEKGVGRRCQIRLYFIFLRKAVKRFAVFSNSDI
jgi:hypothetical protein